MREPLNAASFIDYRKGFIDGYQAARMRDIGINETGWREEFIEEYEKPFTKKLKPKRKDKRYRKPHQSPKQKLLTQMTKNKWDKYKKGKGKKTYVQIRADVSRSQAFKKKAKRL